MSKYRFGFDFQPEPVGGNDYIDKVTLKNGVEYDLRDSDARASIANINTTLANKAEIFRADGSTRIKKLIVGEDLIDQPNTNQTSIAAMSGVQLGYKWVSSNAPVALVSASEFHEAVGKYYTQALGARKGIGCYVYYNTADDTQTTPYRHLRIPAVFEWDLNAGETAALRRGTIQFALPSIDGTTLQQVVDTFTYDSTDATGASDTHTITINQIGGSSAPTFYNMYYDADDSSATLMTGSSYRRITHEAAVALNSNTDNAGRVIVCVRFEHSPDSSAKISVKHNVFGLLTGYYNAMGSTNTIQIFFTFQHPNINAQAGRMVTITDTITVGSAADGSEDTHKIKLHYTNQTS